MARDEGWDVVAAVILGALGLAALAKLLGKKCPYCGKINPQGNTICDSCRGFLP